MLCIQIETQYTDIMYSQIKNRLRLQRLLNHSTNVAQYVAITLGVGILLCHRLLMIDGSWLWLLWVLVPIFAFVELKRTPVLKRHVLTYAELHSGESGFLWFDDEVNAPSWSSAIAAKWQHVELPRLHMPLGLNKVLLLIGICVALMWVPIRIHQQAHLPDVVQQEFEAVTEEVAAIDSLVEESDPQVEAWKETLEDIEEGMSVGNTLRTLDDLSQQIEQRRQEAMESVTEAMEAIEQGDEQQLSKSLESLRKQNMMPSSAQGTDSEEESTTANQEGDNTNQTQDGNKNEPSQNGMTSQQKQLSQQLQQLQSQLQKLEQSQQSQQSSSSQNSSQQSGGIQSLSNDQLQQMAQNSQGQSQNWQSNQSGSGNQGSQGMNGSQSGDQGFQPGQGNGVENSQSQGGEGTGGESQTGGKNSGTEGGGSSPLTYGPETDLIPNTNLRALDGVPQVDWSNSIQFGTTPGQPGEVQTVPVSTNGTVQSISSMTGQQQVAPQHRTAVKEFFAVEEARE